MKKYILLVTLIFSNVFSQNLNDYKSISLESEFDGMLRTSIIDYQNNLYSFVIENDNLILIKSINDGDSWSKISNIDEVVVEDDQAVSVSAIMLTNQRIIVSYCLTDFNGVSNSPIKYSYSDNLGNSWETPSNIYSQMNVNSFHNLIETAAGNIILTGRNNYLFISKDLGVTWTPTKVDKNLSDIVLTDNGLISFYSNSNQIHKVTSSDEGVTWSDPEIILTADHPIIALSAETNSNGKIFLSYEIEFTTKFINIFQKDLFLISSDDEGNSWSDIEPLTTYVDNDIIHSLSYSEKTPYLCFASNRWTGDNNLWFGELTKSTDSSPPAIFKSIENENSFFAYCDASHGIESVSLYYKINDNDFKKIEMKDDGTNGDMRVNDGIYTCVIENLPTSISLTIYYEIIDLMGNSVKYNEIEKIIPLELKNKWLKIGSFQNWYSSLGSEIEYGYEPNMQYGMRWPAEYSYQDNQVSKGMWISTNNFEEPSGEIRKHKVVHVGPRVKGLGEIFPVELKHISKFPKPEIVVNGNRQPDESNYDEIDPNLFCDQLIYNKVNTEIGLTVEREIFQFSHENNQDYIVIKYRLTNSGNTDYDDNIENTNRDLSEVYLFLSHRLAPTRQTRYVIGNSTGWGENTVLDNRGDGIKQDPDNPNNLRIQFGWHGKYSGANGYDNLGAPILFPNLEGGFLTEMDTVGRLGAPQFVGIATLHADKSYNDKSDDLQQPSTMTYFGSDDAFTSNNNSKNDVRMKAEYEVITRGRTGGRHADVVEPDGDFTTPDGTPALSSTGGHSMGTGFGPYNIPFGESVEIIIAEGAGGLSRDNAIEIGYKYKRGEITSSKKNEWFLTGIDSLIKTFNFAHENYLNNWKTPELTLPPKYFSVDKVDNSSNRLSWLLFDNSEVNGFEIYRSIDDELLGYDIGVHNTKYELLAALGKDDRTFVDSTVKSDVDYYYYIQSVSGSNDQILKSSRFYTQTVIPSTTIVSVNQYSIIDEFKLQQNYPNPFNPTTTIEYKLPEATSVKLEIFNILGKRVKTLVDHNQKAGHYKINFDAAGMASGIYFYTIRTKENYESKKMILLK